MLTETSRQMRSVVTAVTTGDIRLASVPAATPAPNEVAGRTLVSLMSPGTELAWAFHPSSSPLELGYSSVFQIDVVGDEVQSLSVGDIVLSTGPHADWQVARESDVVRVPDGLDPAAAVFARLMNVPLSALHLCTVPTGGDALVIGLGLIGQCTARVLERAAFSVTAVDDDPRRRGLVPPGVASSDQVTSESADLIVECTGGDARIVDAVRAARRGGEIVLAGVPWRPRETAPIFAISRPIFDKSVTVRGGFEWQVPLVKDTRAGRTDARDQMKRAMRWLAEGGIETEGLTSTISPGEVVDAYVSLRTRTAPALSYIIDWSEGNGTDTATRPYHARNIDSSDSSLTIHVVDPTRNERSAQ
ncbi:hypothetical protein ACNPNP_11720 [Microbacterium sp. AGC85]